MPSRLLTAETGHVALATRTAEISATRQVETGCEPREENRVRGQLYHIQIGHQTLKLLIRITVIFLAAVSL